MLTNIKLKNFRAFQTEISVRVRPITVLIGCNSAGKSSLLKFLLMLRQTLDSQSGPFFLTEGRHVQLGLWRDLRNSRSKLQNHLDSYLRYALEFETKDVPEAEVQEFWRVATRSLLVRETTDKYELSAVIPKKPISRDEPIGYFTVSGNILYGEAIKHGRHDVKCKIANEKVFEQTTKNLDREGFLRFGRRDGSLNELIRLAAAEQFLQPLRQEILTQRHLSPVREESQQAIQVGSPPPDDVGHRGEYAIPHMARMFMREEMAEQAEFVTRHAAAVAGVDGIEFDSQANKLLTQAKARNQQTGATVSLANFGFGVSQCLPIFVQGAMMTKGQLLLVEQPEAQLHPTAQLELGTFFTELWQERGVPSIIETHSGNIILRLRRLISQGKLSPSDVSIAYFNVEEVPLERGSSTKAVVVKNLDIAENGDMEKGLPMEFFGADILEALEFGA